MNEATFLESDKDTLIEEINKLIEVINKHKYSDLSSFVYSNKYRAIFKSLYDDLDTSISVITGDFDKLRQKNDIFGKEKMNQAIEYILANIRPILPPNATIIKYLSGDEYCFILPNITKEEAEPYHQKILEFLEQEKRKYETNQSQYHEQTYDANNYLDTTYGLTMTTNVVDNQTEKNFTKIVKSGFNGVSEKKMLRNPFLHSEHTGWEKTELAIKHSINEFFDDLRLSPNHNISFSDFTKEMLPVFTELAVDTLLEPVPTKEQDSFQDTSFFTKEEALEVHELLKQMHAFALEDYTLQQLQALKHNLEKIQNLIIKEPLSNMTSKDVFKEHIIHQFEKNPYPYLEVYISGILVKGANRVHTYCYTNTLLTDVSSKIKHGVGEDNFIKDPYRFKPGDNIMIDQGGGNYTLMINAKSPISNNQEIQELISTINHFTPDNRKDKLLITSHMGILPPYQTAEQVLEKTRELRAHCDAQKDNLKIEAFCNKHPRIRKANC